MSTRGQFNTKNPTIKRILKEASELATNPSPDISAEPLEDNLFEWHFTLRGPPAPSPYDGGIYHGRIILPPTYPLRPPSFRFLTPTGRFEVNREICLSISGHHEETWQPAWGIRTAMVAIRSFMDTDAKGQVGGIECNAQARKRMAVESGAFRCGVCGRSNAEIMKEREEAAKLVEKKDEEKVPEELKLAYRDEFGKEGLGEGKDDSPESSKDGGNDNGTGAERVLPTENGPQLPPTAIRTTPPRNNPSPPAVVPRPPVQQLQQAVVRNSPDRSLAWIDAGIYGIVVALLFMVLRKFG